MSNGPFLAGRARLLNLLQSSESEKAGQLVLQTRGDLARITDSAATFGEKLI
jgi:hypothetical protein